MDAPFSGNSISTTEPKPQASFGASGCLYSDDPDGLVDIDSNDVPISMIHSRYDPAVPYDCAAQTVTVARAHDLVAELTSYCGEGLHAAVLYDAHKDDTDAQWTTFLARELQIYSGMRLPSADPVC